MKKGFTLVELLGVIAILALISLIAAPTVISLIKNQEMQLRNTEDKVFTSAAQKYIRDNPNTYAEKQGEVYSITATVLVNNKYLDQKFILNSSYYKNYFAVDTNGNITKDNIIVTVTVVDANKSLTATVSVVD